MDPAESNTRRAPERGNPPNRQASRKAPSKGGGCCDTVIGRLADLVLPSDDDKLEYLKNYNCMPPPIFILCVSVAELIVFIYYAIKLETKQWLTVTDALTSSPLIYDPYHREEAWRFFSYMLLHAGIEHILGNVLLQLVVGVPLEMVHKGLRVSIVYMAGVLAGSLASSIFDPFVYLVGASGGVYALLGGYFSNILMNWSRMAFNGLHLVLIIGIVCVDFGFSIYRRYVLFPDGAKQVSFVAHIAGGIAGITVGYAVFSNFNKKLIEDPRFWACLLSFLAYCGIAVFWNLFLSPVGTI